MSILIDGTTRVIVQGITGKIARMHTARMLEYGTQVVGGVVPGKGGQEVEGLPVFDTVEEAVQHTGALSSAVFVPAPFAADSMMEAADAGITYCTCITEGIPAQDMIRVKRYMYRYAKEKRMVLTGPNCAGTISPGQAMIGVMPGGIYTAGSVGIVSRSSSLGYEAAAQLSALGIGVSTAVGLGGDTINGSSFRDMLVRFEADSATSMVVLIGALDGPQEIEAAAYIAEHMTKPVVAHMAGAVDTSARRDVGHASAIISAFGRPEQDRAAFMKNAGVMLAEHPSEIGATAARCMAVPAS